MSGDDDLAAKEFAVGLVRGPTGMFPLQAVQILIQPFNKPFNGFDRIATAFQPLTADVTARTGIGPGTVFGLLAGWKLHGQACG